jgi:hypothetical protein
MATCDINTLLANAQIFSGLTPGMWDAIELQLLCEIYNSQLVTVSINVAPDYINYAGPPVLNPPSLQNIVVDSGGRQWQYYNGGWH